MVFHSVHWKKTIGEIADMAGQFAIIKNEMWILFTKTGKPLKF